MHEEIKALRSELALLKLQFSERVNEVEKRLELLLAQSSQTIRPEQAKPAPYSIAPQAAILKPADTMLEERQLATHILADTTPQEPTKPSFLFVFIQGMLAYFFDWLSPVTKIYQSYKARGMLGIFTLTIVGIGLTLAGFGYLMQLLIDQLGAGYKSLLMCFAALSVMGLGIGLKIKSRFSEFATAIVTLGILLSYSTVYFSGSVYGILPNVVVLALYLLIALSCHGMAFWLDTKVVAALGIVGIATMPILSNTLQFEPLYYLLSLACIAASSLLYAYRYVGQWLANLTLAFVILSLEWIVGIESLMVSAWTVNLFYLLFFVYALLSLLKSAATDKSILIFIATLIGSTLVIFLQTAALFELHMSINFVLNILVATVAAKIFYTLKRELMPFIVLIAAMWAVLAIVSTLSNTYWGMAWAVEGILLLAIGRQYQISSVVNQGQGLTALALLYCLAALSMYFPLPALSSVDGWLLSLFIVASIAVWQRLINSSQGFNLSHKVKYYPYYNC